MGSVTDYIDCPVCGFPDCFSDYNYRSGEEYEFCDVCGYHRGLKIKDETKKYSELTEDDWELTEILNPYGAYSILFNNRKSYVRSWGYNIFI
jgi:CRISPR/Cas system-associated protein Cas10 (large subunit of type III CRISPR-Cas system)